MKKVIVFSTLIFSTSVFAIGLTELLQRNIERGSSLSSSEMQGKFKIPVITEKRTIIGNKDMSISARDLFYSLSEMCIMQESGEGPFNFYNNGYISAPIVRITATSIGTFNPGFIFANTIYINDKKRNDLITDSPLSATDVDGVKRMIEKQKPNPKREYKEALAREGEKEQSGGLSSGFQFGTKSRGVKLSKAELKMRKQEEKEAKKAEKERKKSTISDITDAAEDGAGGSSFNLGQQSFEFSSHRDKDANSVKVHNHSPKHILACYIYNSGKLTRRRRVNPSMEMFLDVREGDSVVFYTAQYKPEGTKYEKDDLAKCDLKINSGWQAPGTERIEVELGADNHLHVFRIMTS